MRLGFGLKAFVEQMLFRPRFYHLPLMLLLSPLSLFYALFMAFRRMLRRQKDFALPIVSIGNLIVGGSGKTPFIIALSSKYDKVSIISRGYGRQSKGLVEVSQEGKILTDVQRSGDEAMLMALALPKASVWVSEDRALAIEKAKSQGAKLIILDDGFNRVKIKKFEVLLEPEHIYNYFPFPLGAFRESYFSRYYADINLKEESDFRREVFIADPQEQMILVTAISQPKRLDRYLPKGVVFKYYLEDHAYFDEKILEDLLEKYQANSILCTEKDYVKMQGFKLKISQMKLKFVINDDILEHIDKYIEDTRGKNNNEK